MEDYYEKRCNILYSLGLHFNGQEYIKDDFNVHYVEIIADSDQEFNQKIEYIKEEMKRRNLNNK